MPLGGWLLEGLIALFIMKLKQVVPKVYAIDAGIVYCYLVDDGELLLIDTGMHDQASQILTAIKELGRDITDLKHIVLTHCHADHIGGAATLQRLSGAKVYAHALEAPLLVNGLVGRSDKPLMPAPGLLNRLVYFLLKFGSRKSVTPVPVHHTVMNGDTINQNLEVIHTPGHSLGHISLLHRGSQRVLFVADAFMHIAGLRYSFVHEDLAAAHASIKAIAALEYEVACFGHGAPILHDAAGAIRAADFYKR